MKKTVILLPLLTSLCYYTSWGQVDSNLVDSLMNLYIDSFDTTGIVFYKSGTVEPGEPFTTYSSYFLGSDAHSMVLADQWTDEILGYKHYYYELHYKGYRVEAMAFTEHVDNNYIKYANGKLTELNIDLSNVSLLTESAAFYGLLDALEYEADIEWAWENPDWEQQARNLSKDSNATYNPLGQGELLWAIDNLHDLKYENDPSRFQLCWKFELTAIVNHSVTRYYVDAVTGEIYKERNAMHQARGTAITHNYGIRDIETTLKGWPFSKYQLLAEIGSNSYETRDGGGNVSLWQDSDKVKDGDNTWTDISTRDAYTVHSLMGAIWEYMEDKLDWTGTSDGKKSDLIYLIANSKHPVLGGTSTPGGAWLIHLSDSENGIDNPERDLETIAHEYGHIIMENRGKLGTGFEPGALHESFCDILAILIEEEVKSTTNWIAFENSSNLINRRSLIDPNSAGTHYTNPQCTTKALGQPDTYKGTHWHPSTTYCDAGGIHVNCAVPNHWFYLLVNGGTGTNDKNTTYNVSGIGIDKARSIFFHTFMNNLQVGSSFMDCRNLSIQTTIDLYGKCSNEYKQVMNAWNEVNVGDRHSCLPNGRMIHHVADVGLYPNPAKGIIHFIYSSNTPVVVELYDLRGRSLFLDENIRSLDISFLPEGAYILRFTSDHFSTHINLIKR